MSIPPSMTSPRHQAPTIDPKNLLTAAPALVNALLQAGYTTAGWEKLMGSTAVNALHRHEPGVVEWTLDQMGTGCTAQEAQLSTAIRLFVLGHCVSHKQAIELLGEELLLQLAGQRVLFMQRAQEDADSSRQWYAAAMDVRPYTVAASGVDVVVFSDRDASVDALPPTPEHVLGVGSASLSVLQATPTSAVGTVLDLGTGSGIQLLAQQQACTSLTGSDVHGRALDFARATLAGNGVHAEVLQGSWFEPVQGRLFDRIVANPPFVVGTGEVGHVYRDSGLSLDGATELVVSQAADYLEPAGTATIIGAWVHTASESWRSRVARWVPATGVRAWVVQRDAVDPASYIGTWLEDESIDPRSARGRAKTSAWLQHCADMEVTAVGFGFVWLQKLADPQAPSEVVAEELEQELAGPLGDEAEEYFLRAQWLQEQSPEDIMAAAFALRPGVALEEVSVSEELTPGIQPAVVRITRMDGPRWSHEIDRHVASILKGLGVPGLSLGDTAQLYFLSQGIDFDPSLMDSAQAAEPTGHSPGAGLEQQLVGVVVDLVRHGVLIPQQLFTV